MTGAWPDTLPSWLAGAFLVGLTLACVWHAAHDMADDHDTPDDWSTR